VTRAAPCPPDDAALEARIQEVEAALSLAQLRRRIADARRVAREGEPLEWPDEVPAAYRLPAVEAALEAAAEADGGALMALDCDEFPCIGVYASARDPDNRSVSGGHLEAMFEAGALDYETPTVTTWTGQGAQGPLNLSVFALAPEGTINRESARRLHHRSDLMKDEASLTLREEAR